jgi:hypothetical protein
LARFSKGDDVETRQLVSGLLTELADRAMLDLDVAADLPDVRAPWKGRIWAECVYQDIRLAPAATWKAPRAGHSGAA